MVDGLEKELAGSAQVVRLNTSTQLGREMAMQHQVRVLPTFVVLDDEGNATTSYGGRPSKDTLLQAVYKLVPNR